MIARVDCVRASCDCNCYDLPIELHLGFGIWFRYSTNPQVVRILDGSTLYRCFGIEWGYNKDTRANDHIKTLIPISASTYEILSENRSRNEHTLFGFR